MVWEKEQVQVREGGMGPFYKGDNGGSQSTPYEVQWWGAVRGHRYIRTIHFPCLSENKAEPRLLRGDRFLLPDWGVRAQRVLWPLLIKFMWR